MTNQERMTVEELCKAADRMRDAANDLWLADNPDEVPALGKRPMSPEEAQDLHSEAFQGLRRAVYYARRAIDRSKVAVEVGR